MTTLTLNINDLEKLAKNGNDDLVILTKNEYNELIRNAHFHELLEVDDE